ncbi:hypothetical protein HUW82_04620 [Fusobacterium polymorphum]
MKGFFYSYYFPSTIISSTNSAADFSAIKSSMCSFISVKSSISKFSRLAQEEVFMLIPCFLKNSLTLA